MWRPRPPQAEGGFDASFFKRVGPANGKSAYYSSPISSAVFTTLAQPADTLSAAPIIIPKPLTADQIALRVTNVGTATQSRLGIYADNGNVFPGRLVLDSGAVDLVAGKLCLATINQKLDPGLYWLVSVLNGTATVSASHYPDHLNVMGLDAAKYAQGFSRIDIACPFGELPAQFPTNGSYRCGPILLIFLRFSA